MPMTLAALLARALLALLAVACEHLLLPAARARVLACFGDSDTPPPAQKTRRP